jgi:hypothetical protein
MVDFLLQDGVAELLFEFITQIGPLRRPYPHESDSKELKYSYRLIVILFAHELNFLPRATMLLSIDEPSDALLSFLSRKTSSIARAMFEVISLQTPPPPKKKKRLHDWFVSLTRCFAKTQPPHFTTLLESLNLY